MTQPVHSREEEILDTLLQQREIGSPQLVQQTLTAIRGDVRRRRVVRFRVFAGSAGAIAASVALFLTLGSSIFPTESSLAHLETPSPEVATDAALYGEMLALGDLLQPADSLAAEENQQTLSFLIALTQN